MLEMGSKTWRSGDQIDGFKEQAYTSLYTEVFDLTGCGHTKTPLKDVKDLVLLGQTGLVEQLFKSIHIQFYLARACFRALKCPPKKFSRIARNISFLHRVDVRISYSHVDLSYG